MDNQKSTKSKMSHYAIVLIVGAIGIVLVVVWALTLRSSVQVSEEDKERALRPFENLGNRVEYGYRAGQSAIGGNEAATDQNSTSE